MIEIELNLNFLLPETEEQKEEIENFEQLIIQSYQNLFGSMYFLMKYNLMFFMAYYE